MTKTRENVLIFGWHTALHPAAISRDLALVVLHGPGDRNWSAPPSDDERCRPVYCEDVSNLESALCALARAQVELTDLDAVCPAGEQYVVIAAAFAQALRLPGLPLDVALACRDKAVQKNRLGGVARAAHAVLDSLDTVVHNGEPVPELFPAVLKPALGMGGEHTVRVDTSDGLVDQIERLSAREREATYVLEELVLVEEEWEIDGYIRDGEIAFMSLGVYGEPVLSVTEASVLRITLLDPERDAAQYAQVRPLVVDVMATLGVRNSVFHLEVFRQPDGSLVFGECGARPGGSGLPDAIRAKYDFDLFEAHLDVWLGRPGAYEVRVDHRYFGMTQLPTRPGVLRDQPSPEALLKRPGVVVGRLKYPLGWSMRSHAETMNYRMGTVVVEGASRPELEQRMTEIVTWFSDRVLTGPAEENDTPAWVLRDRDSRTAER